MKPTVFLKTAAAALLLTACSSEDSTNPAGSDGKMNTKNRERNELAMLQQNANDNLTQWFGFRASREGEEVSMRSRNGVEIKVNPSQIRVGGRPYYGEVRVEYIEIFDIGNMVTANKTTMGLGDNGQEDIGQLASGGEFYVNMTTPEGQNVDDGTPYTLEVPTELTGGDDDEMIVWEGRETNTDTGGKNDGDATDEDDVIWEKEDDGSGKDKEVPVEDGRYILELLSFGWGNIDKLKAVDGPTTTIYVDVPVGYDNNNSKVYIAYTEVQPTLAPLDTYDPATELFSEHYGLVPVGLQCHIIFVTESGGQWVYAAKAATIAANSVVTIDTSDLITATESSVIAALNGLP